MSRNNRLPELTKAFAAELLAEGFTRFEVGKNAYIALRTSQTSLNPKVVIVTAQAMSDGHAIVGVTINGTSHFGPRYGLFGETWRRHVNESLLYDDILDWTAERVPLRPARQA